MNIQPCLSLLLAIAFQSVSGQGADEWKNGYALKGTDTISCQVRMNSKLEHGSKSVSLRFNNEEASFYPGGPITGFGINDNSTQLHYGTVDVEINIGTRITNSPLFVKKIVAGRIDLYEYVYSVYTTKRTTVNGVEKPGTSSTTSQTTTNHYISRNDPATPLLAKPVLLSSFRKKDLEPYIGDDAALLERMEKRSSLKELVSLLKEYNDWFMQKSRPHD